MLCLASHVQLVATPQTVAHQTPLSMGILQAIKLEWVSMPSSKGSLQLRARTQGSCTAGKFLPSQPPGKPTNTGVGSPSLLHLDPGIKLESPALQVDSTPAELPAKHP